MRSARELIARYRGGGLRPSEVVEQLRDRCHARQETVGAFTATRWEQALAEAREHDAAYRRDAPRGPLAGVPIAVKDLIDTADLVTEYGSPIFKGHRPERDAAVVAAVRRAGAIVVGKTVTHEFAWGITSVSSHGTRCRNPLAPERIAGGSSGGSAAAVADGQVPLALGTDTAGSIRIPAAFCGVTGFKPSYGSVSTQGCWPLAPSLDHVGVIAGDPMDVGLLLAALYGTRPLTARSPASALAVGPDVSPVARDVVARAGIEIVEGATVDQERAYRALQVVQAVEAIAVHRAAGLYPSMRGGYGKDVRQRLDRAARVSEAEYRSALRTREDIRRHLREALAHQSVLVSTPVAMPPPLVADLEDGAESRLRDQLIPGFALQSLLGLPACVIPLQAKAGCPSALQVTGRRGCDGLVLHTAEILYRSQFSGRS